MAIFGIGLDILLVYILNIPNLKIFEIISMHPTLLQDKDSIRSSVISGCSEYKYLNETKVIVSPDENLCFYTFGCILALSTIRNLDVYVSLWDSTTNAYKAPVEANYVFGISTSSDDHPALVKVRNNNISPHTFININLERSAKSTKVINGVPTTIDRKVFVLSRSRENFHLFYKYEKEANSISIHEQKLVFLEFIHDDTRIQERTYNVTYEASENTAVLNLGEEFSSPANFSYYGIFTVNGTAQNSNRISADANISLSLSCPEFNINVCLKAMYGTMPNKDMIIKENSDLENRDPDPPKEEEPMDPKKLLIIAIGASLGVIIIIVIIIVICCNFCKFCRYCCCYSCCHCRYVPHSRSTTEDEMDEEESENL